jgi:hypothetical protein
MEIIDLLDFIENHNIYVSKRFEFRNHYDAYYNDEIIFSVEKITWMRKNYYRVYITNTCISEYINGSNNPYNLCEYLYSILNIEYYALR